MDARTEVMGVYAATAAELYELRAMMLTAGWQVLERVLTAEKDAQLEAQIATSDDVAMHKMVGEAALIFALRDLPAQTEQDIAAAEKANSQE